MRITVTEEHIRKGLSCDCYNCPVALAVAEATHAMAVSVDETTITIFHALKSVDLETPMIVDDFVEAFDSNEPVQPFSFELPVEPTEGRE